MATQKFRTLDEFWPYYVREHSNANTRQLHFIGNINLFIWLFIAFIRRDWKLILFAIVSSYGFAWYGHFFIEKNRPATFEYPLLAGLCNLLMFGQMLRGDMEAEVMKYISDSKET